MHPHLGVSRGAPHYKTRIGPSPFILGFLSSHLVIDIYEKSVNIGLQYLQNIIFLSMNILSIFHHICLCLLNRLFLMDKPIRVNEEHVSEYLLL